MGVFPSNRCLETCLVCHSLRVVFAYIPKAACTSIKRWLVHEAGFAPGAISDGGDLHRYLDRHHSLKGRRTEAERLFADPNWFKFAFVRHPLARLVSAYLDKVVRPTRSGRRILWHGQLRAGELGIAAFRHWLRTGLFFDPQRSLTFREFLQQLVREPSSRVDPHFRTQSRLLHGLPLDFVGRLERSDRDFSVVQERLGVRAPLVREHSRRYADDMSQQCVADWPARELRSLAAAPHWRRFFDASLLAIAERYYCDDFARFGYGVNDLGYTNRAPAA